MQKWEYCVVQVIKYRSGNDPGPARELYTVTLPGAEPSGMQSPHGLMGVLNQLGSDGWELVTAGDGFYMKRPTK